MTGYMTSPGRLQKYPLDDAEVKALVKASCFSRGMEEGIGASTVERASLMSGAVLVLGAFDGLHMGHRLLVASACDDARRRGLPCVAVTFDPDPSVVLQPNSPQAQLLEVSDRARGLLSLGVDHVLALPFDQHLASLTPECFVRETLFGVARPSAIHVGSNFHFGQHGKGDTQLLRQLGVSFGFDVVECPLLQVGAQHVSSTRIRALLAKPAGISKANELLCRCHFVRGVVEHGRGEGTSFGFPTANVRCSARACMPSQGVYGGYVSVGSQVWPAAINVGAPPSFSGPDDRMLEANLIGFSGNLYGTSACVIFVEWLRASRRFSSLVELERVVLGNIAWVRDNLGDGEVSLT